MFFNNSKPYIFIHSQPKSLCIIKEIFVKDLNNLFLIFRAFYKSFNVLIFLNFNFELINSIYKYEYF